MISGSITIERKGIVDNPDKTPLRQMRLNPIRHYFLAIALLLTLLASPPEAKQLQKVTFLPQWVPQAQFAGFYIARERGIYKKYGLDVTILPGGPDALPSAALASSHAIFTTMWLASAIMLKSRGMNVVNLGQIIQKSSLMLVAWKQKGIERLDDIKGRKVGVWGPPFGTECRMLFKKYNLKVREIPQSFTVNLFLRGGVDAASAMWYNEYHIILDSGVSPSKLTTFRFSDYGFNFPEDGIYTLAQNYESNPQICKAFVRASMEGWKYAFSHPEETITVILQEMIKRHIPASRAHQRWMLTKMRVLTMADSNEIFGKLTKERYAFVAGMLKYYNVITTIPDFKSFYKDCIAKDDK